jgi:hypothetical protein
MVLKEELTKSVDIDKAVDAYSDEPRMIHEEEVKKLRKGNYLPTITEGIKSLWFSRNLPLKVLIKRLQLEDSANNKNKEQI